MTLYLFRHGDRTSRGTNSEPLLSATGRLQAECLRDWVERRTLPAPDQLWVSPRKRAQETFAPLTAHLNFPFTVMNELDERTARESAASFRDRVNSLLTKAKTQPGTLFLCSHFDWLEEAISLIPADEDLIANAGPLWSAGAFVGFEIEDGMSDDIWKVRQKGQLQTW